MAVDPWGIAGVVSALTPVGTKLVTSEPVGRGLEASADEEETGLDPSEVPDGTRLEAPGVSDEPVLETTMIETPGVPDGATVL